MSTNTKIVTIDLGLRSYDIYIGPGLMARLLDFLPVEVEGRKFFIIADEKIEHHAQGIKTVLKGSKARSVDILALSAGEQAKSFSTVEGVTSWLLEHEINRDSQIIALGGGVIGDVAGFCASITMRGVPFIQIPTTLLAQVDSAVGGKTGINTAQGKNLIGSFYQPGAVIIDLDTLKTLPRRELLAGYAEIVKYGLIRDSSFFGWLEQNGNRVCLLDGAALSYAIETSVKCKAEIVEADEHETGRRALLNLGHTFGHALEAAAGYNGRLLHGEAVSIGLVMAMDLSRRMNFCTEYDLDRLTAHLNDVGLPTRISHIRPALNVSVDDLLKMMRLDKKVKDGNLRFILINGIGDAFVEDDVPEKLVRAVIEESLGGKQSTSKAAGDNFKRSFGMSRVKGLWTSAFSSHS